ncbi:MAG: DNA polymerase III subunit delta [Patescibacteria group bacterium]
MIIFLYGEDEFRSQEKLKEIENKFLEKNSSGSGLSSFDLEEEKNMSFAKIKEAISSRGLFFDKQLVIIKSLLSQGLKELLSEAADFLKSSKNIFEGKDVVVVFWEKGKLNQKNELFKLLEKKSKSQKFDVPTGAKLNQWIISKFQEENEKIKIGAKALEKLAVFTGGNLLILNNEIKKLSSYKEAGNISEEDVELLVKEKIDPNIFETIEALSSGNKKLALKLLYGQIEKGEDAFYVFSMYVYQFRNFLKVSEFSEKGIRNSDEIARLAKLHPFVVKKILGQIGRFSLEKLKSIYKRLQEIDEKAKTGKGDLRLELERFIVEI